MELSSLKKSINEIEIGWNGVEIKNADSRRGNLLNLITTWKMFILFLLD